MGKLDSAMRAYLSDPEICADFIQHFIFHNRITISPDMLHTAGRLSAITDLAATPLSATATATSLSPSAERTSA